MKKLLLPLVLSGLLQACGSQSHPTENVELTETPEETTTTPPTTTEPVSNSSGGGSLGWFGLLMAAGLGFRRRK